jgi:hypothetical protein
MAEENPKIPRIKALVAVTVRNIPKKKGRGHTRPFLNAREAGKAYAA